MPIDKQKTGVLAVLVVTVAVTLWKFAYDQARSPAHVAQVGLDCLVNKDFGCLAKLAPPEENLDGQLITRLKAVDRLVWQPAFQDVEFVTRPSAEGNDREGVGECLANLPNGRRIPVVLVASQCELGPRLVVTELLLRTAWYIDLVKQPHYRQRKGDVIRAAVLGLRRDRIQLEGAGVHELLINQTLQTVSLGEYQLMLEKTLREIENPSS